MRSFSNSDGSYCRQFPLLTAMTVVTAVALAPAAVRADDDPTVARAARTSAEGMDARRAGDASVDRNLLMPTAETLPKGRWAFNSYELLFAGLSYGVTERLQLSATTLLPITSDFPLMLLASAKYNVVRAPRLLFTVLGNGAISHWDAGAADGFDSTAFVAGGMAIVDGLLDDKGRVVLTGGLMTQFFVGRVDGQTDPGDGMLTAVWTGISARISQRVKLKGELILPGAYSRGRDEGFELLTEGFLAAYGVRFFSGTLGVDLSFVRPLHPDVDTGSLILGLPWVAFTAAF